MGITTDSLSHIICFSAAADALAGEQAINYLYWVGTDIAAADDLLVVDTDSNTLWQAVASVADYSELYPIKNTVSGIRVKTLDHGKVYLIRPPSGRPDLQF